MQLRQKAHPCSKKFITVTKRIKVMALQVVIEWWSTWPTMRVALGLIPCLPSDPHVCACMHACLRACVCVCCWMAGVKCSKQSVSTLFCSQGTWDDTQPILCHLFPWESGDITSFCELQKPCRGNPGFRWVDVHNFCLSTGLT